MYREDIIFNDCEFFDRFHEVSPSLALVTVVDGGQPWISAHRYPHSVYAVSPEGIAYPFGGHDTDHDRKDVRQSTSKLVIRLKLSRGSNIGPYFE